MPAGEIPRRSFIDRDIFDRLGQANVTSAPLAGDEEFLRRVTLDLTGRIPDANDIRAFLADSSEAKRDAAIDRLLGSDEFVDRWTMWLGDLLQNTARLANAAVNRNAQGRNAFHAYIKDAIATGKSLRTIAVETISGSGNNYDPRNGAANYALGASTSMGPIQDTYDTMLVRTTTAFLGLGAYDCLLCHNGRGHLDQVNLWGSKQTRWQAQGMAAFFSRMSFKPSSPNNSFLVEDAASGAYDLNTDSGNRPPRTGAGSVTRVPPQYRDTENAPEDNWREAFAANLVQDPMFARNLANRLWKQLFAVALADPVDGLDPARLDPSNPPAAPWTLQVSHPALLEQLAAELKAGDFQLRPFLRTLVQSSAYQLSSRVGGEFNEGTTPLFSRHYARRLEGEEVHDAIAKATGVPGSYTVAGWNDRVQWAVQLPEPVEPASDAPARNFMDTFLRGDRDTAERGQDGSIQQELALMNDNFVIGRLASRSPKLTAIAAMENGEAVDELFLTFLSRRPTGPERAAAETVLAGSGAARTSAIQDLAWACVNKVEFLYSY